MFQKNKKFRKLDMPKFKLEKLVPLIIIIAFAFAGTYWTKWVTNYFFPKTPPVIELRTCLDSEIYISDWSICTDWKQSRTFWLLTNMSGEVPACNVDKAALSLERSCELPQETKSVTIIENYTSNFSDPSPAWINRNNYGNILLFSQWKFKSIQLKIQADTYVLWWKSIKIPEFYYIMFSVNNPNFRILWARRLSSNRLDLASMWLFQGTETPKNLSFPLSNVDMAAGGNELVEYPSWVLREQNFIPVFNSENGKDLRLTLFVGDGNSMKDPDQNKRIYGRIIKANLEYQCDGNCSIKKI